MGDVKEPEKELRLKVLCIDQFQQASLVSFL